MILITGWDSGVVHPFTSLLWSNGGRFVSDDNTQVLFNELSGQQTLQLTLDLIGMKVVDLALKQADLVAGKGAMIIMANWWRATLKARFPDGLDNVSVAAIPAATGRSRPSSICGSGPWTRPRKLLRRPGSSCAG